MIRPFLDKDMKSMENPSLAAAGDRHATAFSGKDRRRGAAAGRTKAGAHEIDLVHDTGEISGCHQSL
jgi:hypothetical protein